MTLTDIGLALLAQGKMEEARENFIASLQMAWEIQAFPAALKSLIGLAEWLITQNNQEEALPILEMVYTHPATEQKNRDQAASLLQSLELIPENIRPKRPSQLKEALTQITYQYIGSVL